MWHWLLMALSQNPWHKMDFVQGGMTLSLERQSSRILIPHPSSWFFLDFSKAYVWENHHVRVNSTWMPCKSEQPKFICYPVTLTCVSVFRSEALHHWFISSQATTDKTPKQFSAWVITANLLQMLNRWNLYMTSLSINTSTLSYFNCWCNNTMWLLLKGRYMNLGVWLFVFPLQ